MGARYFLAPSTKVVATLAIVLFWIHTNSAIVCVVIGTGRPLRPVDLGKLASDIFNMLTRIDEFVSRAEMVIHFGRTACVSLFFGAAKGMLEVITSRSCFAVMIAAIPERVVQKQLSLANTGFVVTFATCIILLKKSLSSKFTLMGRSMTLPAWDRCRNVVNFFKC